MSDQDDQRIGDSTFPVGDSFAGYRLVELIGEGGMGVVWRATQLALDRTVALKIVRPDFAASTEYRERFRKESRIAASLEHPNVVQIHDAGEEDGSLYLVMAFVDGTDLRALIGDYGSLDPSSAVAVVQQIASGLESVHNAGLVHRDVKPANVLIRGRDSKALLTDFGVARDAGTSQLTRTGVLIGTLDYMAPEQIEGLDIDARADVYSLGAVLYEALTGKPPFTGNTIAAQINAHLNDPPPKPSVTKASLEPFDPVIASALSKDPDKRPSSPSELAEITVAALGSDAITTKKFRDSVSNLTRASIRRPARNHGREALPATIAAPRAGAREPTFGTTVGSGVKHKRRRWAARAIIAATAVALLGVGAVSMTKENSNGNGPVDSTSDAASDAVSSQETGAATSTFAGDWVGNGTQYAPRGTTQNVELRTSISPSGATGFHSESISGPGGTDRCQGTLTELSYGRYRYEERASGKCIAETWVRMRPDADGALLFTETYTTKDGESGRVVGRLNRRSAGTVE